MTHPTLTLCMIVKDESANLPRCLQSVATHVDEMVVLDTGSSDETVAIAQSYGAQVHHYEWTGNFSDARNEALKYLTGDWVLVLDADEALVESAAPALRQVIQQENALVVNLLRQEVGAAQSPYSLVSRLFRRHPDLYFTRPYHAMVDDSAHELLQKEPGWKILDLSQVAILHYGYTADAIAARDKLNKARVTMERFLMDHPGEPYVCSKLGALYVEMGRPQSGAELLERGLQAPSLDPTVLYELHYHLGIAYTRLQQLETAAQHYQTAIQQPLLPCLKLGAFNNVGRILSEVKDFEGAKTLFETCIAVSPQFAIGHFNLGLTLKAMGRFEEAIAAYQKAIELQPDYAEAHQNLGVVLLKVGNVRDSMKHFQTAIALHEHNNRDEGQRLKEGLQQMGFLQP